MDTRKCRKEERMMERGRLGKKKKRLWTAGGILLFVVVAAGLFLWQYPRTTEFGTSGKFFQEEVERLSGEVVALLSEQEYERVLMDYASEGFQRKVDEKDRI